MRLHIVIATTLVVFMSTLAFNYIVGDTYAYHGVVIEPPGPASDFVLTNVKTGQPFRFEQERREITLLYFGYTGCPDVCPTTMGVWKQVKQALGPDAERVRFIFVTVDPERDTPAVLAKYMSAFDSEFIGLSSSTKQIPDVVESYGIWVEKEDYDETALGYVVNHTASTFLVDAQGQLRVSYPFGAPAKGMVEDIKHLLN